MARLRLQSNRLFRDKTALFGNLCHQARVFFGIADINPSRLNSDSAGGKRRFVHHGINAACQTRNRNQPRLPHAFCRRRAMRNPCEDAFRAPTIATMGRCSSAPSPFIHRIGGASGRSIKATG